MPHTRALVVVEQYVMVAAEAVPSITLYGRALPDDFVSEVLGTEDSIEQYFEVVTHRRITVDD